MIFLNQYCKMFAINYLDKLINPLLDMGIDFLWIDYKDDLDNLRALDYYHFNTYNFYII